MSEEQASRISAQPVLTVILILALAVRLVAALALPDQHFGDAEEYRTAGASLWATGRLNQPSFMPLYPALIGLTGPGWGQTLADIALSTATVALVYQITLVVFADRTASAIAALAAAIYPYFIFYAVVGNRNAVHLPSARSLSCAGIVDSLRRQPCSLSCRS